MSGIRTSPEMNASGPVAGAGSLNDQASGRLDSRQVARSDSHLMPVSSTEIKQSTGPTRRASLQGHHVQSSRNKWFGLSLSTFLAAGGAIAGGVFSLMTGGLGLAIVGGAVGLTFGIISIAAAVKGYFAGKQHARQDRPVLRTGGPGIGAMQTEYGRLAQATPSQSRRSTSTAFSEHDDAGDVGPLPVPVKKSSIYSMDSTNDLEEHDPLDEVAQQKPVVPPLQT